MYEYETLENKFYKKERNYHKVFTQGGGDENKQKI